MKDYFGDLLFCLALRGYEKKITSSFSPRIPYNTLEASFLLLERLHPSRCRTRSASRFRAQR
jgi:hypothetical protein